MTSTPPSPDPLPPTIHATAVAREGWAVLLRGPSGSGKSDLALRLILDRGFGLIADDRVIPTATPQGVWVHAPEALMGRIEVRGLGILDAPRLAEPTPLALVVDLLPGGPLERLPDDQWVTLEGHRLPLVRLDPWELTAAHKVDLALTVARGDSTRAR